MKKTIVSMILVGGKGSRLHEITKDTAKPAVSFGAKYRLIDFTLSNLSNSNIDVVGVVTQYEPYELMNYIGAGVSWDLDVVDGGIHFLTPFAKQGDVILWQKGTAHAIKQYFNFIKEYHADFVLILSGDHIYKMDYQKMLEHHIHHNACVTLACTQVPEEEATRFGIVEVDATDRIVNFQEKPNKPKSNIASMGVYLFSAPVLEKILEEAPIGEDLDFGRNVIPKAIKENYVTSAYVFRGYWRDVGTVDSLYEANMDLLDNPDFLTLNTSRNLPVYSKSLNLPPHMILERGQIHSSIVADGALIDGVVKHCVVSYECNIKQHAILEDCVILPNVTIGERAVLKNVLINKNTVVPPGYYLVADKVVLLDESNLLKVGEIRG